MTFQLNTAPAAREGLIKIDGDYQYILKDEMFPFPLVVEAREKGAPLEDIDLMISSTSGVGLVTCPAMATTGEDGRASIVCTALNAGAKLPLTIKVEDERGRKLEDPFHAVVVPDETDLPVQVVRFSKSNLSGVVGERIPDAMVFQVASGKGQAMDNLGIRFESDGDITFDPPVAPTDSLGVARADAILGCDGAGRFPRPRKPPVTGSGGSRLQHGDRPAGGYYQDRRRQPERRPRRSAAPSPSGGRDRRMRYGGGGAVGDLGGAAAGIGGVAWELFDHQPRGADFDAREARQYRRAHFGQRPSRRHRDDVSRDRECCSDPNPDRGRRRPKRRPGPRGPNSAHVETRNSDGAPSGGVPVDFAVVGGSGSLTSERVVTGSDGRASTNIIGGAELGLVVIEARALDLLVQFRLQVVEQVPAVPSGGFVNGASFRGGLVPGSLASIFGTGLTKNLDGIEKALSAPFPTTLGGVRVSVAGQAAPMVSMPTSTAWNSLTSRCPSRSPRRRAMWR